MVRRIRIGRPLAVALALVAAFAAALGAARQGALAQDGPAAEAMLHSPIVMVHTAAGDLVTASLAAASGEPATAAGPAGPTGDVALALRRGDAPAAVLPGDRLEVYVEGARLVAAVAPDLAIALDAAQHALLGRAPPATRVAIVARAPDGTRIASGIVQAGTDGRFRTSLPAAIQAPPGTVATATWPVDAPLAFHARWDASDAQAVLGSAALDVTSPLGRVPSLGLTRGRTAHAAVTGTLALGPPPARSRLELRDAGGRAAPVLPGDEVSLRLDGAVIASARAPRIGARLDPVTDRVIGRIDRQGPIAVVAGGARRVLVLDPAGAFDVGFAGEVDLGPETPAWVETIGVPSFRSPAVAEALTVTLGSERIDGRAPPGWVVAATLRAEDGAGGPVGAGTAVADQDGGLHMLLAAGDGTASPAAPRQRLIVAWEAAPSIEVSLPDLTAAVDEASGTVRGRALPAALVRVDARRGAETATATVRADASGAYTAPLGIALGSGASGRVVVRWDDRLAIARPWAVAEVSVDAAEGRVAGSGATGQAVRVRAVRRGVVVGAADATGGEPVAPWADDLPCAPCGWSAALRDGAFGAPLASGDVLRVSLDGAQAEAEVPTIEVAVNPYTEIASGRAVPGWPVELRFARGGVPSAPIVARADAFGAFRTRVADAWNAEGGDRVRATVRMGAFTFVVESDVGVLDVDLDRGGLSGMAAPGAIVRAGVYPGTAAARGSGSAVAAADGRFELLARDERGAPIVPLAGETVVVQFGTSVTAFELPELGFALDGPSDPAWTTSERASGPATPGGAVGVLVTRPQADRGARARAVAARAEDGSWTASFADRIDVGAGARVEATWSTPDGRRARRAVRLPQLSAHVGAARLSGYAAPGAQVRLDIEAADGLGATLRAVADADGLFAASLGDPDAGRLAGGSRVSASWQGGAGPLGDASTSMVAAAVTTALRAAGRQAIGHGPPDEDLAVRAFGPGVVAGLPALRARAGATGAFTASIPGEGDLPPGTAVEIAHLDGLGHRSLAVARLARYALAVGEGTATSELSPRAVVDAALELGGAAAGTAHGRADGDGFATLDFRPAVVRSGQRFRAVAGGEAVAFDVPTLGAALDGPGRRVHGTAPPGAEVAVRVEAQGVPPWRRAVTAGASGAWELPESMLPEGVTVDRIRLVEAALDVAGHAVVARAAAPSATPGPTATPTATASMVTPGAGTGTASPTATRTAVAPPRPHVLYAPFARAARP